MRLERASGDAQTGAASRMRSYACQGKWLSLAVISSQHSLSWVQIFRSCAE